jgi:hypothetical protein
VISPFLFPSPAFSSKVSLSFFSLVFPPLSKFPFPTLHFPYHFVISFEYNRENPNKYLHVHKKFTRT